MSKAVKANEGIIHLIVACSECGSIFEDYTKPKEAHELAKKHVEETAHTVHVEIGTVTIYEAKAQTNKASTRRGAGVALSSNNLGVAPRG